MGGAFSFVLWSFLNNSVAEPFPQPQPHAGNITGAGPGPLIPWDESRDSPLTLEKIRKLLQPPPPRPWVAPAPVYHPLPLAPTPNLFIPTEPDEEDLAIWLSQRIR